SKVSCTAKVRLQNVLSRIDQEIAKEEQAEKDLFGSAEQAFGAAREYIAFLKEQTSNVHELVQKAATEIAKVEDAGNAVLNRFQKLNDLQTSKLTAVLTTAADHGGRICGSK